jgi:hypothetical protein
MSSSFGLANFKIKEIDVMQLLINECEEHVFIYLKYGVWSIL